VPAKSLQLVHEYLIAAGERRVEDAGRFLDPDVVIIFPQGRFGDLDQMAAAMAERYHSIDKTHHTWDVMVLDPNTTVVVTTGTLHGVNLHDMAFDGIRFCDRFVVRNGLIAEQHVWNDLAESGVLSKRS
jgi:SnoaL-like domain